MDLAEVKRHIRNAVVSDTGYSRGFVYAQYPHLADILESFPATHIDVMCKSAEAVYGRKLQAIYGDRIKLLTAKREKYPTFATPGGSVYYDYAIIGKGQRQSSTWGQVYIGGVMVDPADDTMLEKQRWIVIMGMNRGGTKYIAEILRLLDIGVAHQGYGTEGIVGGGCAVLMPPPGSVILHQVRHPLRTIEAVASDRLDRAGRIVSLAKELSRFSAKYIGHIYEDGIDDPVLWGMRYWYYWNRLSERKALWTYRVEELPRVWDRFCFYLGIDQPMPDIPTNTNTRRNKVKYPTLRWQDLAHRSPVLAEQIRIMAVRYGYDV